MARTVTVTGQGTARVVPDSAVVIVAAVHRARSVEEAFAGVTSAVEAISASARTIRGSGEDRLARAERLARA